MPAQMEASRKTEQFTDHPADLYRVFAFAFALPTRERFDHLSRPDFRGSLRRLWGILCAPREFPGGDAFQSYDEYESAYISLFDVGLPEPPVPLVESAHCKAVPAQQTALENIQFYEVLGLRHDPGSYPPDHLVTQLEFLATVRFAQDQAENPENRLTMLRLERDFLARHLLNWLSDPLKKLEREQPPVFPALLAMLLAFLHERSESLAALANRQN